MGTVDSPQREKETKKKGLKRPKRRIGIRIDMTPMVDIAFLLLIFYMVTTVFAAPQAMEINLPEESEETVDIPRSNLLTIYVDSQREFWWTWGEEGPIKFDRDSLRTLVHGANRSNPKLSTLMVVHPEAKYMDFVDILDEIEVAEYFLRDDMEFMDIYREANRDVLDSAATFSYRYSVRPWTNKDDTRIDKARSSSILGGEN